MVRVGAAYGAGVSPDPAGPARTGAFERSTRLRIFAGQSRPFVTRVMDKAGVDSAHIVGAKTGGAVAMRFAADYPKRTRALVVVGGPASPIMIADPSPIPQRD